jgi:hypothetical protein
LKASKDTKTVNNKQRIKMQMLKDDELYKRKNKKNHETLGVSHIHLYGRTDILLIWNQITVDG